MDWSWSLTVSFLTISWLGDLLWMIDWLIDLAWRDLVVLASFCAVLVWLLLLLLSCCQSVGVLIVLSLSLQWMQNAIDRKVIDFVFLSWPWSEDARRQVEKGLQNFEAVAVSSIFTTRLLASPSSWKSSLTRKERREQKEEEEGEGFIQEMEGSPWWCL